MKLQLFDGTTFEAQVKEEKNSVTLTTEVATLNDLSVLYNQLTNFNLSKVMVTYKDGTHGEYKNLKTVESTWSKKANVISATITLSTKTEFEIAVESLNEMMSENSEEITKTQLALVNLYEKLLSTTGGDE